MHRRQAYRWQGGSALLRPVCWLLLLGVVAVAVTVARAAKGWPVLLQL
jgi:hypothetical protein